MVTPVRTAELMSIEKEMVGGSHPAIIATLRSSAGDTTAYVKDIPAYELVREVLCNLVAQAVGLEVSNCFVVRPHSDRGGLAQGSKFLFATELFSGGTLAHTARTPALRANSGISGWQGLRKAIAFDTWVGNEDRTAENLVFLGKNKFALIDHGEAFPPNMSDRSEHRNLLAGHLLALSERVSKQGLARSVLNECSHFSQVDMNGILVASLAESWNGNPEFAECCRLLTDRLNYLPKLIEALFDSGQGQLLLDTDDGV